MGMCYTGIMEKITVKPSAGFAGGFVLHRGESMQLYQGDCLEIMREIPDDSIDMVLTDPPYSSGGLFAGDRKASGRVKYCDKDHNGIARFQDFSGDNMDQRSFTEFMRTVLFYARQKTKAGGAIRPKSR